MPPYYCASSFRLQYLISKVLHSIHLSSPANLPWVLSTRGVIPKS